MHIRWRKGKSVGAWVNVVLVLVSSSLGADWSEVFQSPHRGIIVEGVPKLDNDFDLLGDLNLPRNTVLILPKTIGKSLTWPKVDKTITNHKSEAISAIDSMMYRDTH